jgi:hypothetical protein
MGHAAPEDGTVEILVRGAIEADDDDGTIGRDVGSVVDGERVHD